MDITVPAPADAELESHVFINCAHVGPNEAAAPSPMPLSFAALCVSENNFLALYNQLSTQFEIASETPTVNELKTREFKVLQQTVLMLGEMLNRALSEEAGRQINVQMVAVQFVQGPFDGIYACLRSDQWPRAEEFQQQGLAANPVPHFVVEFPTLADIKRH